MKGLVWIVVGAVALSLTACQNRSKKATTGAEASARPLDQMESTASPPGDVLAGEAGPPAGAMDAPPPAGARPRAGDEPLAPKGGRTYVVKKGDTLYSLARRFYNGDESKWKVIWEANKARIPNKDHVPVGTKLIIP